MREPLTKRDLVVAYYHPRARSSRFRENSTSLESYNDQTCSATSPEEMTSVRTCYCKQENVSRKKNSDIRIQNENRHFKTIVSKKSIINNETCGSSEESPKRARNIIDGRMLNTNRSVEAQSPNLDLSPETSIALGNAEKIINNAKIQLMEVCVMSSLDSARWNRNIYSDDPPLDDETEELLYIRELVASKFQEASSSRPEVIGKASEEERSSELPRVTVRRVDLSAPKFRMSRRRCADWSSLGFSSDDRSQVRASPAEVASKDDSSSKKPIDEDRATIRDNRARNRRRASSAAEFEFVRAQENACRIQIGPSLQIVDRELQLTRQDLEDVHISPDPSFAQSRSNTAIYTLRHDENLFACDEVNQPKITKTTKTSTSQRDKRGRLIITEAAIEAVTMNTSDKSEKNVEDIADVRDTVSGQDNKRIESLKSQVEDYIYEEERKDRDSTLQSIKDAKSSQHLEHTMNREPNSSAMIQNSEAGDEKWKTKPKNENQANITFGNNMDERMINKESDVDNQACLQNEEDTVNKIQEENQNDRSKPPPVSDASSKTGFLRPENNAWHRRAKESSRPYRTIDEHFSNTFNSHNTQDELCDVANESIRHQYFVPSYVDDFREEDNLNEINLYRPHFDDLDSILFSNDKKIKCVIQATKTFAELLSTPKFARYKLNEEKQIPQYAMNHKEFYCESLADKDDKKPFVLKEPARSSTLETELKNEDLTVSLDPRATGIYRINENSQETSTDTAKTKSSDFMKKSDYSNTHSKNSIESSVYPASDVSNVSRISRKNNKAQNIKTKMYLSESSLDKSDITTFSNIIPALSSTHTETQTYNHQKEQVIQNNHVGTKSRVTSANKLSRHETDCFRKGYSDNIFAQILLSLKDTSEAVDRFVTYILQDEKQSIEKKVMSALKESAITPIAVRKLLDHLCEVEVIRDARQTETLNILKNILINVKSQALSGVKSTSDNEKNFPQNIPDSSIATEGLILQEECARQTQAKINESEIGQVAKQSYDLKNPDKYPTGFLENTTEVVCFEFAQSSKNDNVSKRKENSESESLKQVSDIHSDEENPGKSFQDLSTKTASVKLNEGSKAEADNPDNTNILENKEDDINNEERRNESAHMQDIKDPDHEDQYKNIQTADQVIDVQLDISKETSIAVKEITMEETHNKKSVLSEISKEILEDTSSARLKSIVGEVLTKQDVNLVHSLAKENIVSLSINEKDINLQHPVVKEKISPANSCSTDSLKDCASLPNMKNSNSTSKEVASHNKQNFLNVIEESNSAKSTKDDEIRGKSIILMTVKNREDENGELGFPKNTKNDDKQQSIDLTNTQQKHKINILSSSTSSVSSTLLDCDDRSSNSSSHANAKRIEISSETSHSEGELYMPSSCSYSLGEVRVLMKRDLIADSTTDHDSSVTLFVSKSMLTSLNDTTVVSVQE